MPSPTHRPSPAPVADDAIVERRRRRVDPAVMDALAATLPAAPWMGRPIAPVDADHPRHGLGWSPDEVAWCRSWVAAGGTHRDMCAKLHRRPREVPPEMRPGAKRRGAAPGAVAPAPARPIVQRDEPIPARAAVEGDVDGVLGPHGRLFAVRGGSSRPQQVDLARAVESTLATGGILLADAPTGVGKSFAYLVPAAAHAIRTGTTVIVSTGTIGLQNQIINGDGPVLRKLHPGLMLALAKGRGNYVSLRRLDNALDMAEMVDWEDPSTPDDLRRIDGWMREGGTGDRDDLPFVPSDEAWNEVRSLKEDCLGAACPTASTCPFKSSRSTLRGAHIVVVNHHLLLADAALGGGLLPKHDTVVIDEAHEFERAATSAMSKRASLGRMSALIARLAPRGGRGGGIVFPGASGGARRELDGFLRDVSAFGQTFGTMWDGIAGGVAARGGQEREFALDGDLTSGDAASRAFLGAKNMRDRLALRLDGLAPRLPELDRSLLGQAWGAIDEAWTDTARLFAGTAPGMVRHAEIRRMRDGRNAVAIHESPVDVGEQLAGSFWSKLRSVVLASATLATAGQEPFRYARRTMGIERVTVPVRDLRVDTPFDLAANRRILTAAPSVDPSDRAGYDAWTATCIRSYLRSAPRGGALILFTSFNSLAAVAEGLGPSPGGRLLLRQDSKQYGREEMIAAFKRDGNALLLGCDTFWTGIDVPGEALSHLIITRLPFRQQGNPVWQGRQRAIEAAGGSSFFDLVVPDALIRFRQGIGRLIRAVDDRGTVLILDPRAVTKGYGRSFVEACAPSPVTRWAP